MNNKIKRVSHRAFEYRVLFHFVWIREANKEHPAAPTGLSPLAKSCAEGPNPGLGDGIPSGFAARPPRLGLRFGRGRRFQQEIGQPLSDRTGGVRLYAGIAPPPAWRRGRESSEASRENPSPSNPLPSRRGGRGQRRGERCPQSIKRAAPPSAGETALSCRSD